LPYNDVFVTAYKHPERNTQTLIIINSASEQKEVNIEGESLPESFTIYQSSATENCEEIGDYTTGANLVLPARSLVTLTTEETVTSNNDKKIRSDINIYPNPYKSGKLNISMNGNFNSEADISFYTVSGSLVQRIQTKIIGSQISINPELNPGIYMVSLETEGQKVTKLFCVQ
jgi:hypothetical protein